MEPFATPRALETDEVAEVVDQFRQGAQNAKAAGFDGVEIHGANGYLLDQFLQTGTNRRTDRYGGSAENRSRLLLEVTQAVLEVWGRPGASACGFRRAAPSTTCRMRTPQETFRYVARALSSYGLAYVHGVEQNLGETRASELLRDAYSGTLIMAGGYDRDSGEEALQTERADLIAYARHFLANPDLPERFAQNAPLNDWDQETFYGGGSEGYTDYPTLQKVS